jgi:hypothetical protein
MVLSRAALAGAGIGISAISAAMGAVVAHSIDGREVSRLSAQVDTLGEEATAQKASKTAFAAAINRSLETNGWLCLGVFKRPVDVDDRGFDFEHNKEKMQALQNVRIMQGTETEIERSSFGFGPGSKKEKSKLIRYDLTEEGNKYVHPVPRQMRSMSDPGPNATDICYARKVLDQVLNWEEGNFPGMPGSATVLYSYKLVDVAPWAKDSAIGSAFQEKFDHSDPDGIYKMKIQLRKTAKGWLELGLDE